MYWDGQKHIGLTIKIFFIHISAAGLRTATDGTFPTAKRLVPEILDSCSVKTIRAFFRKSWRYMDAYQWVRCYLGLSSSLIYLLRKGLNAKQAEYDVKKYRSHRKIGAMVMMSLGIMDNPA